MKCQFCNQRCRLLKEGEPDFSNSAMMWYCDKHPTRVLHHVSVDRYALRRDHSIRGTKRYWHTTSVQWTNEKGQLIIAHYQRYEDKSPADFILYHVIKSKQGHWNDTWNEIFKLEEYPKDITPENIVKKVASYIVFS